MFRFTDNACVCAVVFAGAISAYAVDIQTPAGSGGQDMNRRIAELESKVARLRAESEGDWMTQRRADEIRAIALEVLADADTRASLLDGGVNAGWDGGFFIQSADGNFRLDISCRLQVRFVYNRQEGDTDDAHRWGFENRRTHLEFMGHIIDPRWRFEITGDFRRTNGNFRMRTAVIEYDFGDGLSARAGQFTLPFLRERIVSNKRQLAVDRSLVNQALNQGRSQGVEVEYQGEKLHIRAAFTDGFDRGWTAWDEEDTEWAITGRVEALLAGSWKQFNDFTSFRGEAPGLMLGVALHGEGDEYGTRFNATAGEGNDDEAMMLTWTVDASYECSGINLYAAAVGRHIEQDVAGDRDIFGVIAQGGFFFADEWEAFARYEWGDDDGPAEDLSVITVGVNRYFKKHDLKWSADVGYGFNEIGEFWASSSAGWREDTGNAEGASGADGQIVVRSQLQLVF